MFSRRPGSSNPKPAPSAASVPGNTRASGGEGKVDVKKLTALSLAVASVMQPVAMSVAQQLPAQQTTTPLPGVSSVAVEAELELLAAENETLRQATDQFRAGEYEDAAATLSSVKLDSLSASDRRAYDRLKGRVDEAVSGRKAARASFEKGEAALAEEKLADAIAGYKAAASNRYADQATRTKALEQIALAEARVKTNEAADRASYEEAKSLLAKGELDAAKTKFQSLADRGYKPGMFQRSPADYLGDISRRQAAPAAVAEAPKAAEAAAAVPAGPSAKELYEQGVSQFQAGSYEAAKGSFEAAQAAGYRPGLFQRSPADYLKRIEQLAVKPAPAAAEAPAVVTTPAVAAPVAEAPAAPAPAAPAPVAEAPAPPPAPVAPAPVASGSVTVEPVSPGAAPAAPAAEAPAAATPSEAVGDGKAAYDAGVAAFKAGDLASAEAQFKLAEASNYRAGMFQDSPAKWLSRIEARRVELAEAEKKQAERAALDAERGTSEAAKSEARRQYQLGRENYRKGDWIEARKNFVAASEAGYRPGLFEDSPAKFLERMDRKEAADAAKPAVAAATPAASPAVTVDGQAPAAPAAVAPEAPAAPEMTAEQKALKARELVAQARAAEANNDKKAALDLYTQASVLDPANEQATAGRNELAAAMAAPAAAPQGLLSEEEKRILGRRQVVQYSFDEAIGAAREATARGEFPAARQALERARAARNTDPAIFTNAEVGQFDTAIAAVQTDLDRATEVRAAADKQNAADAAIGAERSRIEQARSERERTVSALIRQARTLIEETKYAEALNVIDQILAIDPTNDYAQGVRPLVEDRAVIQQQRRYIETYRRELSKQFNKVQEIQIPYDDLMRFPENWPDISEVRDAENAARRGETALDQATMAILDRRLPEVRFEGVAFGDVVDALRDMTGANVFVEWKTLENSGIDRTTPVTITRLTGQRFEKVLDVILREVGGGTTPLAYTIDEGLIRISTKEQIDQVTTQIVYDVSDLVFRPLDAGPPPQIQFRLEAVERGGGGGGGGGDLFGGGQGGRGQQQDQPPEAILDELVQLIEQQVSPEQWASQGGPASIRRFQTGSSRVLIIRANRATHGDVNKLLNDLRASQSVQVSVEARFLTVSRSFLEDIGLDIDADLNLGGALSPKFGSRTGPNGSFVNNVPIRQNSSTFTENPRTGLPSAITSPAPALSVQGTFIDDFSVDFLIRATQASVSSSVAQAPRLTLFSGQRARVIVGSYQFFVTDLTPVVGTGAVAFQPEPSAVFSGVQLWVEAVVSADRKFVQLNLVPQLRQLTGVQNFTFQTAANEDDGGGGGGTTPPGTVTPVAGIATATIQLPTQSSTQVYTSASVPDGGTILLGGLTQGGEVENEMGVPVLSKVPFLKRLFTNRSNAKDESVVLILVKPTIIISREIEQKSFPLLNQRVAQ